MKKPWETDSCEHVQSYYTIYPVPVAAALWCNIPPGEVDGILSDAEVIPRAIYRHPYVKCLEPRCRAIHEAIEKGVLPVSRENGKAFDGSKEHVAPERRHVSRQNLKEWIAREFPSDKPKFLFDEVERSTHPAISADAYRALKAEHDKLENRLETAKSEFKKLRQEKEAIESERDSLKSIVDSLNQERQKYSSSNDARSHLTDSAYWGKFLLMASNAVSEYPEWKRNQRRVQKTANLIDWLKNSIGADNREAEIIKKVLSDFFIELR